MSDLDSSEKGRVPHPEEDLSRKVYPAGFVGGAYRTMDFLVEHGVEERGIQPRPEDVGCGRCWLGVADDDDRTARSSLRGLISSSMSSGLR